MPTRPHCGSMNSADVVARVRLGIGSQLRGRRRRAGPPGGADLRPVPRLVVPAAADLVLGRGVQQRPERAGLAGQPARGPCWTTRPPSSTATCSARSVVESRWATRMPVRPGEQPLGGAHDVGLGDRVHAGGRLVEHHDPDVAHQQPRERDQLLLARRTAWCRRGRAGCRGPRAAPPTQSVEAQLGDRASTSARGDRPEQRDVLRQRPGQDLGALGDHPDGGAQLLQVEVEHVDAAEQDRCRARARRPATAARPASTCRSRCGRRARRWCPAGTSQVDVLEREACPRRRRSAGRGTRRRAGRRAARRRRRARARRRAARAAGARRRSPPAGRAGGGRACRPGRRTSW